MFRKNDLGEYEARVGGIRFVCDELPPDAEATVEAFAARYQNGGYAALCDYLIEAGIGEEFPGLDTSRLRFLLGDPIVSLDRQTVTYADHRLDDDSILVVEYEGMLERFLDMTVDG